MNGPARSLLRLVVLALAFGSAACGIDPWSAGTLSERPSEPTAVPNGLVMVLGQDAFDVASAELAGALTAAWPNGMKLHGEHVLHTSGAVEHVLSWDDLVLNWSALTVTSGPGGLEVQVAVSCNPTPVEVAIAGEPKCFVSFDFDVGMLRIPISLASDRFGRVQAELIETATLEIPALGLSWEPCAQVDYADPDTYEAELLERLAQDASSVLFDELLSELSDDLGLALATSMSRISQDDGIGTATTSLEISAPESTSGQFWNYADGFLFVPFSVAVDTTRHPCVPAEAELPPAAARQIPSLEHLSLQSSLLVNGDVARKVALSSWLMGELCGGHATRGLGLTADAFVQIWPALSRLDKGSAIAVELWPLEEPGVAFEPGVSVRLKTGGMSVAVLGEIDGAMIRLATLTVEGEAAGDLRVDATGQVWVEGTHVAATATKQQGGLFEAPSTTVAEAFAEVVAAEMLSRVRWQLPPMPGSPDEINVTMEGAYLVFWRPQLPNGHVD